MTGRDTPAPDRGARLVDGSGVPGDPALLKALEGIGVLAAGPAPEVSAELAQLMAAGGRAPAGRRNKRRMTFLGGALAVSMGVGMSGVAAGTFPFRDGPDDSAGAGTRFAARESADRVPTLPAPAPERSEGPEDLTHEGAGKAPIEPGIPAAAAGAAGMGPGTAAAETRAVHRGPVQPDPPLLALPAAAESKGDGDSRPRTSAPGTRPGPPPSISAGTRPVLHARSGGAPQNRVSAPQHRVSAVSADGGGFAAVGRDRPVGEVPEGAVSEDAGASLRWGASLARVQAPSGERFGRAPEEATASHPAAEEQRLMFSRFLGGTVADAGEWVPDELLPVLPEGTPITAESSPVPADSPTGEPTHLSGEEPAQEERTQEEPAREEAPAGPLPGEIAAPAADPLDADPVPTGPSGTDADAHPGDPTEQPRIAQVLGGPVDGELPRESGG